MLKDLAIAVADTGVINRDDDTKTFFSFERITWAETILSIKLFTSCKKRKPTTPFIV